MNDDETAGSPLSRRALVSTAGIGGLTAVAGCIGELNQLTGDGSSDGNADLALDEDFEAGSLSDWRVRRSTEEQTEATVAGGALELGVYRCNRVSAETTVTPSNGTIRVSFSWQTSAQRWYEVPGFQLLDSNGPVEYTVVSGTDIQKPGQSGEKSGYVTVEADVSGPVSLRFQIQPSDPCSNFDHEWTYLRVDDVIVKTVDSS